jgi:hypothetical protein
MHSLAIRNRESDYAPKHGDIPVQDVCHYISDNDPPITVNKTGEYGA